MNRHYGLIGASILATGLLATTGCGSDGDEPGNGGGGDSGAGAGGKGGAGGTGTGKGGGGGEGDAGDGNGGDGNGGEGGSPVAATCSDDIKNGDESDVDCGGEDCDPCADGNECSAPSDCTSGVCDNDECAAPECGDEVKNADEDCDSGGDDTAACNADCTTTVCGDGHVNEAAGEVCERPADAEPWHPCNTACGSGVLLDGTWSTTNIGDTDSPWEQMATDGSGNTLAGLQSFHYSGQPYIFDLTANTRYDIAADEWSLLTEASPVEESYWANGAVDSTYLWVPRDGKMYRFDLSEQTWETLPEDIPDGYNEEGAAIFDGAGFIWYHGGDDTLVKYDTSDGSVEEFSHATEFAGFDVYETRLAYDPHANRIVFTGYENDTFLIFDIEDGTFSESAASPGGGVSDNSCQDRAGGIYVGSQTDPTKMYRYDIAQDDFTELPVLPVAHDNNSTCVVSEDGYLYFATSEASTGEFFRLKLNLTD